MHTTAFVLSLFCGRNFGLPFPLETSAAVRLADCRILMRPAVRSRGVARLGESLLEVVSGECWVCRQPLHGPVVRKPLEVPHTGYVVSLGICMRKPREQKSTGRYIQLEKYLLIPLNIGILSSATQVYNSQQVYHNIKLAGQPQRATCPSLMNLPRHSLVSWR